MTIPTITNTCQAGSARVLIYREGKKYVGVCLDFDLVVHGKTLAETEECIQEMVEGYFQNAIENKLPVTVLNRPAPRKYWNKYVEIVESQHRTLTSTNTTKAEKQKALQTMILNRAYSEGRLFA